MGQQQLLLIILGVIIVGIAIAVGISQFGAHSTQANKDGVTSSLVNVAANAYQFRIRPTTMGGGGGDYSTYAKTSANRTQVVVTGTSSINGTWTATCTTDSLGKTVLAYTGW